MIIQYWEKGFASLLPYQNPVKKEFIEYISINFVISDFSYVTQVYVSCSGDNTSIVKQDDSQKTITLINDDPANNKVIKITNNSPIVIKENNNNNNFDPWRKTSPSTAKNFAVSVNQNKTLLKIASTKHGEEGVADGKEDAIEDRESIGGDEGAGEATDVVNIKDSSPLKSPSKVMALTSSQNKVRSYQR